MRPTAVLFDYGHTLVDFRRTEEALHDAYERIRERIEAVGYMEMPEILDLIERVIGGVEELVMASYRDRRMEELDILEVFRDGLEAVGFTLPPDVVQHVVAHYHAAFTRSLEVLPATTATLERLRDDGYRMGLVSNVTLLPELMQGDLETLGLAGFFDSVAFSSHVGVRKPDPRIFTHVLDELGVEAPAAVFVGDRLVDDIGGAHAVGMRAVQTREFRREDAGEVEADAVIDRLEELPETLSGWS